MFPLLCIYFGLISLLLQDEFTGLRHQMVESQIKARGVEDTKVLEAMKKVPRHEFVPNNYRSAAYQDRPLSIGQGQTISQPYIVGFMTAAINPDPEDVVLEIGTGSGYQAAVLAEIVDEVYTLEIVPELGERSKKLLKSLGYKNVHAKVADGYHGWLEHAPFDAIVVTAAAEEIPKPLIEQLADPGRMIIPVGPQFEVQYLVLVTKKKGKVKMQNLFAVRFVPFTRD
jgi:protein-L-isoaspartate(D-aspartate) O-methyltransferase